MVRKNFSRLPSDRDAGIYLFACGSPKYHRKRGALRISNIQFEAERWRSIKIKHETLLHAL